MTNEELTKMIELARRVGELEAIVGWHRSGAFAQKPAPTQEAQPDAFVAGSPEVWHAARSHRWWGVGTRAWDHTRTTDVDIGSSIFRRPDDPNNEPPKIVRVIYTLEELNEVLG